MPQSGSSSSSLRTVRSRFCVQVATNLKPTYDHFATRSAKHLPIGCNCKQSKVGKNTDYINKLKIKVGAQMALPQADLQLEARERDVHQESYCFLK